MPRLIITLSAISFWAVLSVTSRIVLLRFDLDPWTFSFLQVLAGGACLLLIGARYGGTAASFARPSTWALGSLRVTSAALYTTALGSVSVLEAGVIGTISLPVIAGFVWMMSRQRPPMRAWAGYAILVTAIVVMSAQIESHLRLKVLSLMALNAVCLSAMNLIAENHPENTGASPAARAWFTGVVLVITAGLFLVARLLQGGLSDMLNPTLICASFAVGVLLRAPSMFLTFSAIRTAGAQSYTAAIAFLPLIGMLLEQGSFKLGLLDHSRFQITDVYIGLVALTGALVVWSAKRN